MAGAPECSQVPGVSWATVGGDMACYPSEVGRPGRLGVVCPTVPAAPTPDSALCPFDCSASNAPRCEVQGRLGQLTWGPYRGLRLEHVVFILKTPGGLRFASPRLPKRFLDMKRFLNACFLGVLFQLLHYSGRHTRCWLLPAGKDGVDRCSACTETPRPLQRLSGLLVPCIPLAALQTL